MSNDESDLILHRGLIATPDRSDSTSELKGFWGALGCACWAV